LSFRIDHARESQFWYFLARRAAAADRALPRVFNALTVRAGELGLPIVYKPRHAAAWAVICQLFVLTQPIAPALRRFGFNMMLTAFEGVLGPQGFPRMAFERILGNIQSPSFPDRSRDQSVVDSFLANGLRLVDESRISPSMDSAILETCLADEEMCTLGAEVCQPPSNLLEDTVSEYKRRRPGLLRRYFMIRISGCSTKISMAAGVALSGRSWRRLKAGSA